MDLSKEILFSRLLESKPLARIVFHFAAQYLALRQLSCLGLFCLRYFHLRVTGPQLPYFSVALTANEKKTIKELLSPSTQGKLSLAAPGLTGAALNFRQFLKIAKIIRHLCRHHDLLVALRGSEYLAYYLRLYSMLEGRRLRGVLVFTDGNPHGLALLHVAGQLSLPVTFISHGEPQPPLHRLACERAFLFGQVSLSRYTAEGSRFGEVIFQGRRHQFQPMRVLDRQRPLTVGIFLSKLSSPKGLQRLIDELTAHWRPQKILVRAHPNFRQRFASSSSNVFFSEEGRLIEDVKRCDFVIAGNSTVHLEVLLYGRPSLYSADLDEGYYDRNGFVRQQLVLDWAQLQQNPEPRFQINSFFGDPQLVERLKRHLALDEDFQASIERLNDSFV